MMTVTNYWPSGEAIDDQLTADLMMQLTEIC